MSTPRLFLIDSYGFIFRAYHARARSGAPPMRTSRGMSTEAVYIFHNMLRRLRDQYKPEYLVAVWESLGPTFRDKEFADYKANRAETPPDLVEQIPQVRRLLEAMRVSIAEFAGFEADDVIGAIAKRAAEAGLDVVIVSSDKDMMQLVGDRVTMMNPMKDDEWYDAAGVERFMGVKPEQVRDLLALKGDSVDNIPGAPGIGDKGAKDLIVRFGSVEAALDRAAEVERRTYRESLQNNREQILLSKRLATIVTDAPIEWTPESAAAQPADVAELRKFYQDMEFLSFLKDLAPDGAGYQFKRVESTDGLAKDARVAIVVPQAGEGELMPTTFGVAWKAGEACSLADPECLRSLITDPARRRITYNAKALMLELKRRGVEVGPVAEDVMLYGFLLNADPSGCTLANLAERYLGRPAGESPEEQAECVFALADKLGPQVEAAGLGKVYDEIDLPLAAVLARMERWGIRIDPAQMRVLGGRMDVEMQRLAASIYEIAGRTFNINSPQQLAKVLFEDMAIPPPVRYGKGKTVSTAADVLEAIEHPIAAQVLEYRQLAKLKGTYVDALPALIDPATGRLHTTFHQTGAATGRLSSSDPNLQNIPIRTELGREIRAAFVPEAGWKLVVADYSQIELRLLAHLSRDPLLVESFERGEDIHTRTAAEVFGVPPLMVTREMRSNAKAVNFGIVYGQTPFGLAAQLGIPRVEAEVYIRSYFERYAGVKKYITATVAAVRQSGVATTIFGRQRPIPDMHSRNANARSFAERTAVNTPMQGSAADLIKLAMIRIDSLIAERGLRARMLLQVHDELVFEAPPEEVAEVRRMAKREMESVYKLAVPLVADVGAGDNWRDAK